MNEIEKEIRLLESRLSELREMVEGAIYTEPYKGGYIVVKPWTMEIAEVVGENNIRIHTILRNHNMGLCHKTEECMSHITSVKELEQELKERDCIFLPVYMLIHSCKRFSVHPFNDTFDSGLAGFIYITREDATKNGWTEEQSLQFLEETIESIDRNENNELYATVAYLDTEIRIVDWGFKDDDKDIIERSILEAKEFIDDES